jgi:acetylornithine deacetylase/succinyl-diaminopimelate desuccinylase-like protein
MGLRASRPFRAGRERGFQDSPISEGLMKSCVVIALMIMFAPLCAAGQQRVEGQPSPSDWERYQDETVKLMQEYLRIDTSNPPGNELAAAQFFHRIFEEAGITNTIYPYAPGRADIYAVLKGDGSLRPLVFLNHMDVVRAESKNWREPPFAAKIVDGEMYGRGALDMKDEGLLQAMVMIIAKRAHLPLKRDLIFLATADEEVGDSGSTWFVANHPELVRDAEYLLTEGGSNVVSAGQPTLYGIGVAEKAPFWIRVVATGQGGHGSIPIVDSAPNRLIRALRPVVDWQPPFHLLPLVEQYFREISRLETGRRAEEFRHIRKALQDPSFARDLSEDENYAYLLRDTVSLTVLKGSTQTNVIPDTAYAELDVRLLPGEDPQAFLAQLRSVIADDTIQLEPIGAFRPPNSSSTDTGLYRIIESVVHEYDPQALVAPVLNSGYTESQMYRPLGITCYGFAPVAVTEELDATQHAANERIPVEQLSRGVKMLYEMLTRVEGNSRDK